MPCVSRGTSNLLVIGILVYFQSWKNAIFVISFSSNKIPSSTTGTLLFRHSFLKESTRVYNSEKFLYPNSNQNLLFSNEAIKRGVILLYNHNTNTINEEQSSSSSSTSTSTSTSTLAPSSSASISPTVNYVSQQRTKKQKQLIQEEKSQSSPGPINIPNSKNSNSTNDVKKKVHHKNKYFSRRYQRNHNTSQNDKRKRIKAMFREAKNLERTGRWRKATQVLNEILTIEPRDSHSHLALARLESRREQQQNRRVVQADPNNNDMNNQVTPKNNDMNNQVQAPTEDVIDSNGGNTSTSTSTSTSSTSAREVFHHGTTMCPNSIHLWQAWAVYEQGLGNLEKATQLFNKALEIDDCNPYACHAFGLMEQRGGNIEHAKELWEQALTKHSTAALVCSLGQLYASSGNPLLARDLYAQNVNRLKSERERTEVYLAAAWLEERHFYKIDQAKDLIQRALTLSPTNGRARLALLRLERRQESLIEFANTNANANANANANDNPKNKNSATKTQRKSEDSMRKQLADICNNSVIEDGRLFNAWASLEIKEGRLGKARSILQQGMKQFPKDQSLVQAAGKVEERRGNFSAARNLYSASLSIQPSAPTLIAFAMLELRHPSNNTTNITMVRKLFDEALLLDPRHGPAYNAYGNMELRYGNKEYARSIFEWGVEKNCTDPASVYHGYAKLELSEGNVDKARDILIRGLQQVERQEGIMLENAQHKRAIFLAHTLGMLELNSHRVAKAKSIFENGIQKHGDSSQLLLGAALCEVRLGNENGARGLFEQAVNADKRHAHAWQTWAVMEMRAGNIKVAKTLFECGIKSAPKHGALWQAYATLESRMGNFDAARILFAAGIRKCPKHAPLYQAWACLELRGGNLNEAKKLISEALTRNKREGSCWLVAAKIEEKQNNNGLALLLLRRGLQYAPNNPDLYCALANQEVKRGHIYEARSFLEKGLEVDPLHAPLYHSLAELEARVFNVEGLANLHKRASKVFNNNALVPPPDSSQAWSKKIRMGRWSKLPDGVTALMEKVGLEEVNMDRSSSFRDVDPSSMLDSMAIFEDGTIGEMLDANDDTVQHDLLGSNNRRNDDHTDLAGKINI